MFDFRSKQRGFTLIEVLVVMVIVAIIASFAIPSYIEMLRKSRRVDAVDSLLLVQSLQEKYRVNNSTYGTLNQIGFEADTNNTEASNEGHYTISLAAAPNATDYLVRATPTGDQASDTDCAIMRIVVNAGNPRGAKQSADSDGNASDCW